MDTSRRTHKKGCKRCGLLTRLKVCGICRREKRGELLMFVYDGVVRADALTDMLTRKDNKLIQSLE